MRGWHKQNCVTCGKETWHYQVKNVSCCVHCVPSNNLVGGAATREVKAKAVRIANKLDRTLWAISTERRENSAVIPAALGAQLFSDSEPTVTLDPNKVTCTFCGAQVDHMNVLTEKKAKIRIVEKKFINSAGELDVQRKVTSQQQIEKACPNCCLKVQKPIVARIV